MTKGGSAKIVGGRRVASKAKRLSLQTPHIDAIMGLGNMRGKISIDEPTPYGTVVVGDSGPQEKLVHYSNAVQFWLEYVYTDTKNLSPQFKDRCISRAIQSGDPDQLLLAQNKKYVSMWIKESKLMNSEEERQAFVGKLFENIRL